MFPTEATQLGSGLAVVENGGEVQYFTGMLPVFSHAANDEASFRMFAAQLCVLGAVRQAEILRVFGVPKCSLIRWVHQYRDHGAGSFFKRKGAPNIQKRVWNEELLEKAQAILNRGATPSEVASELGLKADTVRRAILTGRLKRPGHAPKGPSKGQRSARDAEPPAGRACHDTVGRFMAASRLCPEGVARRFTSAMDVPRAGVLCALPALLVNGLLHGVEGKFTLPPGFYPVMTYFLLVAFMLLTRLRLPETLRRSEPGEWGLLLGHDRCPEAKTLRKKLEELAHPEHVGEWSSELSSFWMQADPDLAGVLYVDGHVRLYHGSKTKLPQRFVSRQRLCLRSMMDYWLNDQEGRPFFVLTALDTEGLLSHLTKEIIPRLLKEVPNQPGKEEMEANPDLHRFDIIVDREGFSPTTMVKVFSEHRIAMTTYRKHPYDPWPESDFQECSVPLAHGQCVQMKIASRSFGNSKEGLREIRRLTPQGKQTAIITGNRVVPMEQVAGRIFSRWSQENYFRYAMHHFGIDRLAGYSMEEAPESITVINPAWRDLDAEVRKLNSRLNRYHAELGSCKLPNQPSESKIEDYQQKMSDLGEKIEALTPELLVAKNKRKAIPKRISLKQIPEADRPKLISPNRKRFVDTLAMLAYRAETAQMLILRDNLARKDDARTLIQALYQTSGDLIVNETASTLTVRLHRLANQCSDKAVTSLLAILNDSETQYPGTNLRLVYEMVSSEIP